LEPFGTEEDYRQAGIISSVIANVNRAKNRSPFSADDFMPVRYKPEPKKQTVGDMKKFLNQMVAKQKRKK